MKKLKQIFLVGLVSASSLTAYADTYYNITNATDKTLYVVSSIIAGGTKVKCDGNDMNCDINPGATAKVKVKGVNSVITKSNDQEAGNITISEGAHKTCFFKIKHHSLSDLKLSNLNCTPTYPSKHSVNISVTEKS